MLGVSVLCVSTVPFGFIEPHLDPCDLARAGLRGVGIGLRSSRR